MIYRTKEGGNAAQIFATVAEQARALGMRRFASMARRQARRAKACQSDSRFQNRMYHDAIAARAMLDAETE